MIKAVDGKDAAFGDIAVPGEAVGAGIPDENRIGEILLKRLVRRRGTAVALVAPADDASDKGDEAVPGCPEIELVGGEENPQGDQAHHHHRHKRPAGGMPPRMRAFGAVRFFF